MVRQIKKTLAKYAMVARGERLGVAVSGGPDSVAMLQGLLELAPNLGITLGVVHLNHRLRGKESEADQRFVERLAASRGLDFCSQTADVASRARREGENLEQTGRNVRYEFFRGLIEQGRFDKIAVGHTRSDQAETVLFRLLRGSGSAGLAGIRPQLDWGPNRGIVRPLIEVTREQVMAYLESRGSDWREDSTNRDPRRSRNRIRHQLIPQLAKDWNPKLTESLAQLAEQTQAEEEFWAERLQDLAAQHLEATPEGILLPVDSVASLPLAELRRLLRVAIERARGDLRGVDYQHVEALREMLSGTRGTGSIDLPGLRVQRSFGEICLSRTGAGDCSEFNMPIGAPGFFGGPWGPYLVTLRLYNRENLPRNRRYNEVLDWEKLPKPLRLRNWRAGDSYKPQGRAGAKKLKSLFQEGKIAVWERGGWPVIVGTAEGAGKRLPSKDSEEERIVWVRRFGPAAEFAPDGSSRVLLEVAEVARKDADFTVSDW